MAKAGVTDRASAIAVATSRMPVPPSKPAAAEIPIGSSRLAAAALGATPGQIALETDKNLRPVAADEPSVRPALQPVARPARAGRQEDELTLPPAR